MIKIAYFDEDSAMDYINIIDGGSAETISGQEEETDTKAKLSIGAKIATSLKFLNFFQAGANVESNAELVNQSKNVVKSTITNTILTDFIKKTEEQDNMIKKFSNVKLVVVEGSFTHLKIYTPYTYIVSDESKMNKDIAINKLDSTMEKIKGYYEFLVIDNDNSNIFRFNINCLRNNYKLTDLLKMDLCYYAVKVGTMNEEDLIANKEINIDTQELTAEELVCEINGEDYSEKKVRNKDVYDVILAGVEYTDER